MNIQSSGKFPTVQQLMRTYSSHLEQQYNHKLCLRTLLSKELCMRTLPSNELCMSTYLLCTHVEDDFTATVHDHIVSERKLRACAKEIITISYS